MCRENFAIFGASRTSAPAVRLLCSYAVRYLVYRKGIFLLQPLRLADASHLPLHKGGLRSWGELFEMPQKVCCFFGGVEDVATCGGAPLLLCGELIGVPRKVCCFLGRRGRRHLRCGFYAPVRCATCGGAPLLLCGTLIDVPRRVYYFFGASRTSPPTTNAFVI